MKKITYRPYLAIATYELIVPNLTTLHIKYTLQASNMYLMYNNRKWYTLLNTRCGYTQYKTSLLTNS